jgi:hypothetical protein
MIGTQRTGRLPGVHITGTTHEGLIITANGQPAQLAIVTADGRVLVAGPEVAAEAEAVTVNLYQRTMAGTGHLRELPPPAHAAG